MSTVNQDKEAMTPAQNDQTHQDPRVQLGHILKQARIRKELSYDDVIEATCIRQKIIEALEEGNFTKIGSETYIKGFIKTYATYLGLLPDTLLALYDENPVTKKYIHPFDMAFPSPITMAPTRKLILTCGLALFFLLTAFTLYENVIYDKVSPQDFVLSKFSSYLNEEGRTPEAEAEEIVEQNDALPMMPYGDPETMIKQVSRQYRVAQGTENIVLEPSKIGWVELYSGDELLLRTKLMPSRRYYLNKEPNQKLVVKEGNWLKASFKGQPLSMDQAPMCNDYTCIMPE